MSAVQPKLYLNLYWHMHQPDYRDTITGQYVLPWTYLHAMKDYTDMAYHLESNPKARVTFNFVPVLLDQLEDYTDSTPSIFETLCLPCWFEIILNISQKKSAV